MLSLPHTPPLLKWAGGKRWFASRYANLLRSVGWDRFVEPFAGGLSLSFFMKEKSVLACDINPYLINFYQTVQNGLPSFVPEIRNKERYLNLRAQFNVLIKENRALSEEGAILFWTLNRMGYNGLCRFNRSGLFNTPFGLYKTPLIAPSWSDYQAIMKNWVFQHGSFEDLQIQSGDFIFCDPPYDQSWQGYYHQTFSCSDQEKLARWLKNFPGKGLIMNHATSKMSELYQDYGFALHYVQAPRRIGPTRDSRRSVQELIATHHFSWKDLARSV